MMAAKLNHGNGMPSTKANPLNNLQISPQSLSQLPKFLPSSTSKPATLSRKNHKYLLPLAAKKDWKGTRGLITVSFPSGQWPGNWSYEYVLTLRDLQLDDLAEDGSKHTRVYISLSLHKHAGFGVSADGRIVTSIARTCKNCFSSYSCEIDTTFDVWVLQSTKEDSSNPLPELGGDPSVIYVKPGYDAILDSLVQETLRLQILVKETCSDACEKADTKLHYIGVEKTASLDRRWSKLRDFRATYLPLTQKDE